MSIQLKHMLIGYGLKKNVTASMMVFGGDSVKCQCYQFVSINAMGVDIAVVDFAR